MMTKRFAQLLDHKFATRNRVYLDIRSELGLSYNFYQNYGDTAGNNLKLGNSQTVATAQKYERQSWSLLMLEDALETASDNNDLKLNLRVDDNTNPLLYLENTALLGTNHRARFLADSQLLGTGSWTQDINLQFPNVAGTGSSKLNMPYYIKLAYGRQDFNPVAPKSVPHSEDYFNNAFCPLNLPNLGNVNDTFQRLQNPTKHFLKGQLAGTDFAYVTENGAYWDNDRILFYAQASHSYQSTGKFYSSIGIEHKLSLESQSFQSSFLNKNLNISCQLYEEEVSTGQYEPFKAIAIGHYTGVPNFQENLLLLGITLSELEELKLVAASVLSPGHPQYLFLEEETDSPKLDKQGRAFRKFTLNIQGMKTNGEQAIVTSVIPTTVYSRDGFCFTSGEFAEKENTNEAHDILQIVPMDETRMNEEDYLYNFVKRLAIFANNKTWKLYDLEGKVQKYATGEKNYGNQLIAGKDIELPVGTRVIILGNSTQMIAGASAKFIVCFHEGKYREGFVDFRAFFKSNKNENNELVRVNEAEGNTNPEVIWKPFLDDAHQILHYCEKIQALPNIFPPFDSFIDKTKNKLKDVLTKFTPYQDPQNFINALVTLNDTIHALDNISEKKGNLAINLDDKVDSLKRWLDFSPLKDEIIAKVTSITVNNIIPGTFQTLTLVLPLTKIWFNNWGNVSELKNLIDDKTAYTVLNFQGEEKTYKFEDIMGVLQGASGNNYGNIEQPAYSIITHALNKLIEMAVDLPDGNILKEESTEIKWLIDLSKNSIQIDNRPNFIVIDSGPWEDIIGRNITSSFVLSDASIGYINSITPLTVLIHEINTYHSISDSKSGASTNKFLYFDTHGGGFVKGQFDIIQHKLQTENSALGYFETFEGVAADGAWLALMCNPHSSILYLNHYLKQLLP